MAMSSPLQRGRIDDDNRGGKAMGKLVVTEFVSLDGVMQAPGGEEFKYPGWSFAFDRGDDGNDFKLQETLETVVLLLGRITYESFAGAWPEREGEFADKFNAMPKYVVSSTLEDPEWNSTTVVAGSATEHVKRLKQEVDGTIQVPGSLRLAQELFESDLVDELHLMVFPVVLGTGRRLFGETSDKTDWRLVDSRPVGPDGVLVLVYERKR
jgi:dihydrofolate reductase